MDKHGVAVADGEITEQNELGHSLNSIPEDDLSLLFDFDSSFFPELSAPTNELSNPSPDSLSFSIDQIEHLLMMDDDNQNDNGCVEQLSAEIPDDFFSDILLDSPVDSDRSAEVVDVTDDGKNSNSSSPSPSSSSKEEEEQDEEKDKVDDSAMQENINANVDDKKLRRQLRNRDAAVRSRERKKSYVKDLEMKSRYFEEECRRLGMLLQCCAAENQALRLSLQNAKAYDASMTKQESAVLLLESLLMGSLLWFLGIVCLFILPKPLPLVWEAVPPENVDRKNQGSLALLRKAESNKVFGIQKSDLFVMSRRCKASRSRMKKSFLRLGMSV